MKSLLDGTCDPSELAKQKIKLESSQHFKCQHQTFCNQNYQHCFCFSLKSPKSVMRRFTIEVGSKLWRKEISS
ncbi:CLUMA_CG014799, isoform A [Clunio marinus]|uniref:CLUMA_CG014799, isoform A n=1 Tax=Clunio marinus TaxID=568069 RepID=A0A1J1IRQ6_9DIPT|nr:CLUMA_CG014799, isoform A [Clunio marinus]